MRQFVGSVRDETTVRDLLVSVASPRIREAARTVDAAEHGILTVDDEVAQMRYAQALADWAEAQGYEAETLVGHLHHGRAGRAVRQGPVAAGEHPVRR